MFPFSFKVLCDCGRLSWLTMIPFLSQRFCLLVQIRTVVPGAISGKLCFKLWVTVCFSVVVLWVNVISEGKVVLNMWPNNFSAGEVPFWSGCEFRDNIVRKWSSELSFALLRVCLTVWMHLSTKLFDWWLWGLIILFSMSQVVENMNKICGLKILGHCP